MPSPAGRARGTPLQKERAHSGRTAGAPEELPGRGVPASGHRRPGQATALNPQPPALLLRPRLAPCPPRTARRGHDPRPRSRPSAAVPGGAGPGRAERPRSPGTAPGSRDSRARAARGGAWAPARMRGQRGTGLKQPYACAGSAGRGSRRRWGRCHAQNGRPQGRATRTIDSRVTACTTELSQRSWNSFCLDAVTTALVSARPPSG